MFQIIDSNLELGDLNEQQRACIEYVGDALHVEQGDLNVDRDHMHSAIHPDSQTNAAIFEVSRRDSEDNEAAFENGFPSRASFNSPIAQDNCVAPGACHFTSLNWPKGRPTAEGPIFDTMLLEWNASEGCHRITGLYEQGGLVAQTEDAQALARQWCSWADQTRVGMLAHAGLQELTAEQIASNPVLGNSLRPQSMGPILRDLGVLDPGSPKSGAAKKNPKKDWTN